MKTAGQVLALALVVLAVSLWLLPLDLVAAQPSDQDVPGGHFYTQTSPEPGLGYRVVDDPEAPFWDAFRRYGGVEALGYPISRRFILDGFVSQATQRAILQWDPAARRVMLVNILDRLHDAGRDAELQACCSTPPPLDPAFDASKTWEQVVADRQALLDDEPLLRQAYYAASNPLDRYGLPTSRVTDMGNHLSIRTQRTVLQLWKVAVPWASAGQVTVANSGDLARIGKLIPLEALAPESPSVSDGLQEGLTENQAAALASAAARVAPATVKVIAAPSSSGSGFIISDDGLVLTANHVVEGASRFGVILPDGRRFAADLVGSDSFYDVALLRIDGESLPAVEFGGSGSVARGDPVVALGYGALTPQDLDINPGRVVALGSSRRPGESARTTFFVTDVGLVPGFSGGPLVDGNGRVVGMNTAVITAARSRTLVGQSLAVAADAVDPVVRRLIAGQTASGLTIGITSADLTEEVASAHALSVNRGALVLRVARGSAADLANLQPGDIITRANGWVVSGVDDLATALASVNQGGSIDLVVVGHNGLWRSTEVKAVE